MRGALAALLLGLALALAPAAAQEGRLFLDPDNPAWTTPSVAGGRVQYRIYDSAAAKAQVSFHVYAPESYERDSGRRFPVLYWLHGSGGGLAGVRPLAEHFDKAIRAGLVPPMLVVFPNGMQGSMWVDSKDGRVPMETVLIREILPLVDKEFRTLASREGRLVEGFSMGGYGAGRLGFKYPELFAAVSMLGAGPLQRELNAETGPRSRPQDRERLLGLIYGGDQAYFRAQSPWVLAEENAEALRGRTKIRMAIGGADSTLPINREFEAHLAALAIPHEFVVVPGVGHETLKVLEGLDWAFYREAFGAF
ncbi:MAG: esterase family protein [Alphaproteobacteria bacterium]|nr:esterase family protein [Alphaproteobacteria bacterium]